MSSYIFVDGEPILSGRDWVSDDKDRSGFGVEEFTVVMCYTEPRFGCKGEASDHRRRPFGYVRRHFLLESAGRKKPECKEFG